MAESGVVEPRAIHKQKRTLARQWIFVSEPARDGTRPKQSGLARIIPGAEGSAIMATPSARAADHLPVAIDTELGTHTLELLDKRLFTPSRLPANTAVS